MVEICETCKGTGMDKYYGTGDQWYQVTCSDCEGFGIPYPKCEHCSYGIVDSKPSMKNYDEYGVHVIKIDCSHCGGTGFKPHGIRHWLSDVRKKLNIG